MTPGWRPLLQADWPSVIWPVDVGFSAHDLLIHVSPVHSHPHTFNPSNKNSSRWSCHTSVREHASSLCRHKCVPNSGVGHVWCWNMYFYSSILHRGINHTIYTWLYVCARVKKIYVACCFFRLCGFGSMSACVWSHLNRVEGGERGNKERMITRQASCSLQICRPSSILPLHSVKHIDQPLVIERGQCAKSMFHFSLSLSLPCSLFFFVLNYLPNFYWSSFSPLAVCSLWKLDIDMTYM